MIPGGSQSYCCSGFVPSSFANTNSLKLFGHGSLSKPGPELVPSMYDQTHKAVSKGVLKSNEDSGCLFAVVAIGTLLGS
jgi:hypothetical protein